MHTDAFGRLQYDPPLGWARREGTESFNAEEEWQRLVERGLKFEPYYGPTSICWARGTCMEPLLSENQYFRTRPVAPAEPLVDGGLYIFEAPFRSEGNPEEIKAYCDKMGVPVTPKNTVMKFLRFICGEWRYQCNQGVGSLAGCQGVVISQVVAVLPPMPASLENVETVTCDTGQVGANAVSQMVSNYSAAAVNTNNNVTQGAGSSTDANVITAAVTATGSPMAIDVGCTVTLTGGGSPGSSFTSGVLDVFMDGSSIGSAKWDGTNLANYGGGSTPPAIQVTLSATNTPAAGAHTYALHAHVAGSGSAWSCTIACVNNFIKVREIKK